MKGLIPRDWAAVQLLDTPKLLPPLRTAPSATAERPDAARTARSEASSINRLIDVIDLKTPGSMGGGDGRLVSVDCKVVSGGKVEFSGILVVYSLGELCRPS